MNRIIGRTLYGVLAGALFLGSISQAQSPITRPAPKGRQEKALDASMARLKAIRNAGDGLAIINGLLEDKSLSPTMRKSLEKEAVVWKERSEKGLVRNGTAWITPAEKERIEKEAALLIEKGILLISTDQQAARDAFERSSKLDDTGISADFLLGMLNTPLVANSPETAEKHFRRVLSRAPRHLPSLNNLALSCVQQKEFVKAIDCWQQMADVAPNTPELSHNLGKLLDEASKGLMILTASEKRKFQDIYLSIATSESAPNRYEQGGWRYMNLSLPKEEANRTASSGSPGGLILAGNGSGFVIAPGVILTNRHVVEDAHSIKIEYEGAGGRQQLDGKVKKISELHDLALIECPTLSAPPVNVITEPQRRGTEVMILGYPKAHILGKTIKATRGSITALPSVEYEGMLLFDAAANPGNSGGPVSDQQGNVIAVLTAIFRTEGQLSCGTTISDAVPFVKESYPNFTPRTAAEKLDWPDVDAKIAKSTVMVSIYQKVVNISTPGRKVAGRRAGNAPSSSTGSYIEDFTCSFCSQQGAVRCPAKGCNRGQLSSQERIQAGNNPITGQPIYKTVTNKRACGNCNGDGKVPCRACGGIGFR